MKSLILIRGLEGAGKATLANLIVDDREDRVSLCAFDYFFDEEGNFNFDPVHFKKSQTWCLEECESLIDSYDVIVVHNSFTRKWECAPYYDLAKNKGMQIHVISLYDGGLNDHELAERNEYGVPVHIIKKQRSRWDLDVNPNRNNKKKYIKNQEPPMFVPNPYYAQYHGRRGAMVDRRKFRK